MYPSFLIRLYLYVFFISLPFFSLGNFIDSRSISGRILDKSSGQPIIGATLTIPDLRISCCPDFRGNYLLKNLPKGQFLVQVKALGYASTTRWVDLENTLVLDFYLSTSHYELADVLVTSVGNTTTKLRTPIPISLVSHDRILEEISNTVLDVLAKEPGVNETTEGAGTTKPQINGLGFNRVLVLMDGLHQEDFQWGDDHGLLIDPYSVYEAEIIRGPASLQFGASAEAGVISFKSEPFPELNTLRGSLLTEFHTNNGLMGTSFQLAGNSNGFIWDLKLSGEQAHSYSNPKDGYVWGSAWNQTNARLTLAFNKSWGYSKLSFSALHRRIEIPTGNRDSLGQFIFNNLENGQMYPKRSDYFSYRADIASDKILEENQVWWQNSLILHHGRLGLDIGFTQSVHHDIDSGSVGSDNLLLNDIPFTLKYQLNSKKSGIKLTTGLNGNYEYHTNLPVPLAPYIASFQIPNYTNFEIGGYAIFEKDFKNLSLTGGLRYDHTQFIGKPLALLNQGTQEQSLVAYGTQGSAVQFSPFHNTYGGISGSLGLSYQFAQKYYFKWNVSKSFRAPAINELTSNGLNIGSNAVQLGNSNLKAEEGYQVDLAYGKNGRNMSFEWDAFYNQINHFIFANRTDSVQNGYPVYTFVSSNTAILTGVSGFLNIHPMNARWLEWNNGFTYIYSFIPNATDSTHHLPWIPAPHLSSEIKVHIQDNSHTLFRGAYVKLGLTQYWGQRNIYSALTTEIPSASYSLWNAGLGTNIAKPKSGKVFCSLYLNCTNLTNLAYADHLNLAQYFYSVNGNQVTVTRQNQGIYNMGRNFSLKLVFPLSASKGKENRKGPNE